MIGRQCDWCKDSDKPVYPHYEVSTSMTMEFQISSLGFIESKGQKYKCNKCYQEN